ncbi:MAG: amidohydrolase family protein [Peptococcaceae bacterium]|jgi:cytosine deaminase|nr:amidohydrolase family protein [Peptococcaceae bacterium]MDH7525617.1 amidohydrolase family protein [Peptococcaceae bacterium]
MDLLIRKARAFGYQGIVDIAVKGDRIADIGENLQVAGKREIDAGGKFVSPGLVNPHAHLDKALLYDRFSPNLRRGTLSEKIVATREIKKTMTAEDVKNRSLQVIKMAVKTGTTAIRTFVEADPLVEMRAVEGMLSAKKEAKEWLDLQTIAFAQEGWFNSPGSMEMGCEEYVIEALKAGADVIGGNVNRGVWPSSPEKQVDRMFQIAREFDCDVDMHLDNADTPEAFALPYVVQKTVECGYQGRVAAGHVIGIAHVEKKVRDETIKKVKEAGLSVVVLPQRIRLTCVRELVQGGVNVAVGTDNIRNTFAFLGSANLVYFMLLLAELLGVQTDEELVEIYKMGTVNAARAMRLKDYGLEKNKKADLVVFDAPSAQETIINQAQCLYVIKNGRLLVDGGRCLI